MPLAASRLHSTAYTTIKMEEESSKAIIVKKFGSYDAISVGQFKLPPLDGLVEVDVEYGGLNFVDLYTRQGLMYDRKLPFVLGMECSGIITNIGVKDSKFKVGQKVICYDYKGGMYRQKIRVSEDKIYPLPNEIGFEDGAALLVNYLTAYFSVFELGHLQKNQSVLILSCAGGVGWAATQLCKTVGGVKIIGTASPGKEDILKNGIDSILPLDDKFETEIKSLAPQGFDLIISNQSGRIFTFLQTLLRPLGRIVILGANDIIQNDKKLSAFTMIKMWLGMKNISLESIITNNRAVGGLHLGTLIDKDGEKVREVLEKIFELVKSGKIKPKIHGIYSMDNVVEATKLLAERKNVGKVLINMKN